MPYRPHPAIAYGQVVVRNLCAEHGRDVAAFAAELAAIGLTGRDRTDYLKQTYGMGATQCSNLLEAVDGAGNGETYDPAAEVSALFAGKRAWMLSIYSALLAEAEALGDEVWISPCRTMVPFYRGQKFMEAKPETNSRFRLYLALDRDFPRLEPTVGRDDKYTHFRPLESLADIDDDLRSAMRAAYALKEGAQFPWGRQFLGD
jgi:hypothetical protein